MSLAMPGGDPVAGKRRSRFEVSDHDRSELMSMIHGYYKLALDRLPLSLIPRVREAGLCVGFLDPVSNILVNTILIGALPNKYEVNQEEQGRRAKKRTSLNEKEVNQEDRLRRGKKRMRSQPGGACKQEGTEEQSEEGIEEELEEKRTEEQSEEGIEEELEEKRTEEQSEEGIEEELEEKRIEGQLDEEGTEEQSEEGIEEELYKGVLLREIEMSFISKGDSSIAARSLRGLITFLTSYFRYLHTWEALFYLVQSRGDLLAAVNLIEQGRGTFCFTTDHPTTKVSLACAALAAMHPQPDTLVSNTLSLASRIGEVLTIMLPSFWPWLNASSMGCLAKICEEGVRQGANLTELMFYTSKRLNSLGIVRHPIGIDHELSMKRVLLDKIHVLYLEAISRFPTALLCSRLHRALLKAGYCCGPFGPVANILLNTIWYDTAYPSQLELEVHMIRMENLGLIESCSLNGLVAFTCALFPKISMVDALLILIQKNANLYAVLELAKQGGRNPPVSGSHAYEIAASKSRHPNPSLLAELAGGLMPAVESPLKHLDKSILSPDDVQAISKFVLENHPPTIHVGPGLVPQLNPRASEIVSASRKEFEAHQELIHKIVEAALREHARRQGDDYEVHAICGVNTNIPEDGQFGYFLNQDGYPFSHINVWVTQRGEHHADAARSLLFIECSNDCEGMKDAAFMCALVSGSSDNAGRCFHCERAGTRIVHPSLGLYHGQSNDFKLMACGKHSVTNKTLVGAGERMTVFVDMVTQDFVYFDPAWDADTAKIINFMAREERDGDDSSVREERDGDDSSVRELIAEQTENLHQDFFEAKNDASVFAPEAVM